MSDHDTQPTPDAGLAPDRSPTAPHHATTTDQPVPGGSRRWATLTLLAVTQFVVVLDSSIVNIALPSLGRSLHMSATGLSWVVNTYLLAFGGLLLLGGRAADLLGRRAVFATGLLLFTLASLTAGLAPDGAILLASRAVQGTAAAIMSPAALSIVTTVFPEGRDRDRALGIWGAVAGSGGAAGVLLGGILTSGPGWPWIFFINVPVGALALLLTPKLIPALPARPGRRSFDLAGATTVTGGLVASVLGLVSSSSHGWTSPRTLGPLAIGALLLVAFVAVERRAAQPLLPPHMLRRRTVATANTVMLMTGGVIVSLFYFLALHMQQVLEYSPLRSGLAQLPLNVALIVAAACASRLLARAGAPVVLTSGLLLLASGLLWLAAAPVDGSFLVTLLGPLVLIGAGIGLALAPVNVIAYSGVPPHETGLAGGLVNTSQQTGGALFLAVLTTLAASRTQHLLPGTSRTHALAGGYHWAFAAAAALAVLAAAITTLALARRERPPLHGLGAEQPS
ncbi:hypothetical protein SMD11_6962 [Streptomyces albireticuli]|uniref:Major facilitator superfamily (MFS) profile domain-containing protein n=1 Tax=Streptomyces albireticuli TaxID=1940 RepID=A0A1Z2LE93_9ACTN|nr:MFS transporter [Streptomyces albireticuli]ARZ72538.1 hypothetical protein SMD11_6962 [Streptomyces albireticuli]